MQLTALYGPEIFNDKDGKTEKILYYKDNYLEGNAYQQNGDGSINNIQHYQHGAIRGICTFFYPNGQVSGIYNMEGKTTFDWRDYSRSGQLIKSSPFVEIENVPDTLNVGSSYSLRLQLMFPMPVFHCKYVLSVEKINELSRVPNTDLKIENGKAVYDFTPKIPGRYYLKGEAIQFIYCEQKPDSMVHPFPFPFEKEFIVLGAGK
jgi:hypothetical protein